MEAQRLSDPDVRADGDGARVLVRADEPADEVVAAPVLGLVLIDHQPDHQPLECERLQLRGERLDVDAQPLEGRFAGQLEDDVALGGRDDRTTNTASPVSCASGTNAAAAGDSIRL